MPDRNLTQEHELALWLEHPITRRMFEILQEEIDHEHFLLVSIDVDKCQQIAENIGRIRALEKLREDLRSFDK